MRVYFNYVDSVQIIYDHKDCYNFLKLFLGLQEEALWCFLRNIQRHKIQKSIFDKFIKWF